jgi:four helix bundle protein
MRDHRRLEAFQLADALTMSIYEMTARFPKQEQFVLVPQLRRAAISASANIVEGCARDSKVEYLRFLGIAYASARELQYELSIAARLDYLCEAQLQPATELAERTCRALHGLIKALREPPGPKPQVPGPTSSDTPT